MVKRIGFWAGIVAVTLLAVFGAVQLGGAVKASIQAYGQAKKAGAFIARPVGVDFVIVDDKGVKRPPTIEEVLELVAQERVVRAKEQQQQAAKAPQSPPQSPPQ